MNEISAPAVYRTNRLLEIVLPFLACAYTHTHVSPGPMDGRPTKHVAVSRNDRLTTLSDGVRITRHVVLYTRTTVATAAVRVQHRRVRHAWKYTEVRCPVYDNRVLGYGAAAATAVTVLRARGRRLAGGWVSAWRGNGRGGRWRGAGWRASTRNRRRFYFQRRGYGLPRYPPPGDDGGVRDHVIIVYRAGACQTFRIQTCTGTSARSSFRVRPRARSRHDFSNRPRLFYPVFCSLRT